jgi:hypothetical protein
MNYTKEQLAQIDIALHARFEESMNVFCAEAAPHNFSRNPDGSYVADDIMCMWAGFILNYMTVRQAKDGAFIEMKPGLLEVKEAESGRIILL